MMSATKKVRAKDAPPKLRAPSLPRSSRFEYDAHVLELDDVAGGFTGHYLDGVLVTEVVGTLDGVEGVGLPVVLAALLGHGCVDAALGGVGVAADGVDF